MRLTFFLLFILLIKFIDINAQAPEAFRYQTIVRDVNEQPLKLQNISARFTIHNINPSGNNIYQEISSLFTDSTGYISFNIGTGTVVSGNFSAINWKSENKYMQIEIDLAGGTSYSNFGTVQLVSVPYSMHSKKSSFADNGLFPGNSNGNILKWDGTKWKPDSLLTNTGTSIAIGHSHPDTSAIVDLKSNTKGFLMPRMSTAERNNITNPVSGLQIFNLDDLCINTFNGLVWLKNCELKSSGTNVVLGPDAWKQKLDFTSVSQTNMGIYSKVSFSINGKGYITTGNTSINNTPDNHVDNWEYNPSNDTWSQKADFAGVARSEAVGFALNGKGYVGTGLGSTNLNDFWEYDPVLNTWTQKNNFGGGARRGAVSFIIGSKAYVATGFDSSPKGDLWEYDAPTDVWIQKQSMISGRYHAAAFSYKTKGYVCTGTKAGGQTNELLEYNQVTNLWTVKSPMPDMGRNFATGFGIGDKGYIGSFDYFQYDIPTNRWSKITNRPDSIYKSTAFTIGNKAYVVGGMGGMDIPFNISREVWEYTPPVSGNTYSILAADGNTITFSIDNWRTLDSVLYNSEMGSVGIGTSNPENKLSVIGNCNITGNLGIGISNPQNRLDVKGGIAIGQNYTGNTSFPNSTASNVEGYIGIGTTANLNRMDIAGAVSVGYNSIAPTEGLIVEGKFGVGKADIKNKLDVAGNTAIGSSYSGNNTAPVNGIIIEGKTGINTAIPVNRLDINGNAGIGSAFAGLQSGPVNGLIIEGNTGIGMSTPVNKLDVEGNAAIGNTYAGIVSAGNNNLIVEGKIGIGTSSAVNNLDIGGNIAIGSNYAGINSAPINGLIVEGNVGVGNPSPSEKLAVNGTVKFGVNGSTISNIFYSSVATSALLIAANTTVIQNYNVGSVSPGASVLVSPSQNLNAGILIAYSRVSGAGIIEVSYRNITAGSITLSAGIPLSITTFQ